METPAVDPADYAIGACLTCFSLTLLTSDRTTCYLCGRPPDLRLPFTPANPTSSPDVLLTAGALTPPEPAPEAESSPASPAPDGAPAEPETVPVDEMTARYALGVIIGAYVGGSSTRTEELYQILCDLDADPEDVSSAIGRLAAVRELLDRLFPLED